MSIPIPAKCIYPDGLHEPYFLVAIKSFFKDAEVNCGPCGAQLPEPQKQADVDRLVGFLLDQFGESDPINLPPIWIGIENIPKIG